MARCPRWAPSSWHHIQWYAARVSATRYRYDTLVVDDHGYEINQIWAVNPHGRMLSAFKYQLDQANATPIHKWIDNVKLTLWY
jgi:hypothetical protein